MVNNITQALEMFEKRVTEKEITSFRVAVRDHALWIQTDPHDLKHEVALEREMYESLSTFFYGVDRIEYNSHDYTNLKCFVNARVMIDRLLNKEGA